jgi:hypothetical protein
VSTCGFWLYFGDLVAQTDLIYDVGWYYCSEISEVPPNYAVQAVEIYIGVQTRPVNSDVTVPFTSTLCTRSFDLLTPDFLRT